MGINIDMNTEINRLPHQSEEGHVHGKQDGQIKTQIPYDKTDFLFALILPALGFLFIKLIVAVLSKSHFGLGVFVFTLCFTACVWVWSRREGMGMDRAAAVNLALVLLLGGFFVVYQNVALQCIALFLLIAAAAYWVLTVSKCRVENKLGDFIVFDMFYALCAIPFGNFGKLCKMIKGGFRKKQGSKGVMSAIVGVLLALPVCLFVGTLLKDADAAFAYFWQRFALILYPMDFLILFFQIVISVPVSFYLYGLIYGAVKRKNQGVVGREEASEMLVKAKALPYPMVIGGITPLLALYLLFFFSQTAYFLSAFRGILPQDMVYAEYARRGFFELCAVSMINLCFLAVLVFFTKGQRSGPEPGKAAKKPISAVVYSCMLTVFSLAMIIISLSKMFLYIHIYGLTPLRVYTSWFMVFLLAVFLSVFIRIAAPSFNVVKYIVSTAMVMFLLLCYADTDRVIAWYNVEGYRSGKLAQLDVPLLGQLGSSATGYLIAVIEDDSMDPASKQEAREILRGRLQAYENGDGGSGYSGGDWRNMTLSGYWSGKNLAQYRDTILSQ